MRKASTAGQVSIGTLALGLLLATLMNLMVAAKPAHAGLTFTVNSTGDAGTGGCNRTECTLREAIGVTNRVSGADTIRFAIPDDPGIPGNEVKTISPTSPLPAITDAATIDGYTQAGAVANTLKSGTNAVLKVQLNGTNAEGSFVDGFSVTAANVVVRGLVINRFNDDGIDTSAAGGIRIEGNFIGTDASGTQDLGNGDSGAFLDRGAGITFGGVAPEARNLISGNGDDGVVVFSATKGTKVEGNLIGTKKGGENPLGNSGDGVNIINSSRNLVGGTSPGAANTIAFNSGVGVNVVSSFAQLDPTGNRISGNSIFSNGRLGIDLVGGTENAAGATTNDTSDPDTGANDLQNKPVVTSARTVGGKTTVRARLDSSPRDPFVVEFFSDPSGNEGKQFIGDEAVSTNANGNASFEFVPSRAVAAGHRITATATDVVGANTSEFSAPKAVVAQ